MNDKEMIEFWKRNERPFGLCPKECQEWLDNYYGDALIYTEKGEWSTEIFDSRGRLDDNLVIRIPADYQPEKRGRWVECAVGLNTLGDQYIFNAPSGLLCFLHEAPGMVGFGGVRYGPSWFDTAHWRGDPRQKPEKPVSVRFWVED